MTAIILALGAIPVKLEGFDMDANIVKTTSRDANKATLRVYNLPEEMRSALQGRKVQFSVSAGYSYANSVRQLGLFDIRKAHSELEGPTWVTHIEGAESRDPLLEATVSLSISGGSTVASVARQVVDALVTAGLSAGNFEESLGTVTTVYHNGFCAEGRAKEVLAGICKRVGFKYSVQNGALQFLKEGEGDTTKIYKMSPDTGLIGIPVAGEADASKNKKPQVHVKSLCRPEIVPGSFINVILPVQFAIRGNLKVNKVIHDLSTYAQAFYTKMECELGGAKDTVTAAVDMRNIA
jgi:hypothetical protein